MKINPVGAGLFNADGQAHKGTEDKETEIQK